MAEKDPLDELIVDEEQAVDKSVLAGILKDKVKMTKQGEIIPTEKFLKAINWKKIILFLLARKVADMKGLSSVKEKASQKEISEGTFMPESSVRRYISVELKGIVKKDKSGYYIPNYNIMRCQLLLAGKEKVHSSRKGKGVSKNAGRNEIKD